MAKVSRAQMPNLIKYSLNMLSALDIQEAFRLTGIHPFDPSIINCLKQTLSKESDKNDENNPNCLVDVGIVPQSLADILVPPPVKPSKGKRKVTGARLITACALYKYQSIAIHNLSMWKKSGIWVAI